MFKPTQIDDIVRRVQSALPADLEAIGDDVRRNVRAVVSAGLDRMEVVTREEFDVQSAVLSRTREKLEQLEARVEALSAKLSSDGTG